MIDPHVRDQFLRAAVVPRDASHRSGVRDAADALLAEHPGLAEADIFTATVLGQAVVVRAILARDFEAATRRGGPYDWDPLTWLCFSRYLRDDAARPEPFVRTAEALLDAGASARTGFFDASHTPAPAFESALYGVAGVAHHAPLTALLLQRGADPNDDEVTYHAPESYETAVLTLLLESRRLTPDSLNTLLLRKSDWHHLDGMRLVLDHGADPNTVGRWGRSPLAHAIRSGNDCDIVTLLLDHGADPTRAETPAPPCIAAAYAGRRDLLELFEARGFRVERHGLDALVTACALHDTETCAALVAADPDLVAHLHERGAELLIQFATVGNTNGVAQLLDLGIEPGITHPAGNGYFGLAPDSTALHAAAWLACHATVQLLLDRGAPVDVFDSRGRTPLTLAVRACVDSYWTERRAPTSVAALLAAGASPQRVGYPCGYGEVDALLAAYGARASH